MPVVLAAVAALFALRWASRATSRRRMFNEVGWILLEAELEVEE